MTTELGRRRPWILVAVVGGVLLGVADLLLQRHLPYPWANLANSSAVWAIAAFTAGWWLRSNWWRSALAGAVLLVVALESYYLAAVVILHDDVSTLWSATAAAWLVLGVLGGALFGAAGSLAQPSAGALAQPSESSLAQPSAGGRTGKRWLSAAAAALPSAVLLAEAARYAHRPIGGDTGYWTDSVQTAVIEAALALVLLVLFTRDARSLLRTGPAVVLLAGAGFGAFQVIGFA